MRKLLNKIRKIGRKSKVRKCKKVLEDKRFQVSEDTQPVPVIKTDDEPMVRRDDGSSKYIWRDQSQNRIKTVVISWGDRPPIIHHIVIDIEEGVAYRNRFPVSIDEKKTMVNNEKKRALFEFLENFDFTKWRTDEKVIYNLRETTGYQVTDVFQCVFDDNTEFCCATPPEEEFKKMVAYFNESFPGE